MDILAAELPDQGLSLSVPDTGGCDITKPNPVDQRFDMELDRLRDDWLKTARYALTLSSDGDWNVKTTVAEWLTYAEATRLRKEMGAALLIKKGGIRRWADASYGISLHTPPITKGNKASVGDLLLHEQVVPHGEFSLSGSFVLRQFHVAAEVTTVTPGGRILSYRDRAGDHIQTPKKPYVVSSSVIDVQGVLANILANVKTRGDWAAEFGSPNAIQSILVRYQRLKDPVYPVMEAN